MHTDAIKDGNREEVDEDRRKEPFSSCISSVREAETLRRAAVIWPSWLASSARGKHELCSRGAGTEERVLPSG